MAVLKDRIRSDEFFKFQMAIHENDNVRIILFGNINVAPLSFDKISYTVFVQRFNVTKGKTIEVQYSKLNEAVDFFNSFVSE